MASNTNFLKLYFYDNRELLQNATAMIQARCDDTYVSITPQMTTSQFSDYIQELKKEIQIIEEADMKRFSL